MKSATEHDIIKKAHLPPGGIALQIFALAFQHPGSNLYRSRVIFPRVGNILDISERDIGVDQLVGIGKEGVPFDIFRHRYGSSSELLHSVIRLVRFSLENTGICIVGLLNLTNDNGLKFASRLLQVQECLASKSLSILRVRSSRRTNTTYPV